jgi:hypothetical protein
MTITADFMYEAGEMGIVTKDDEGVVRVWGYDPAGA